ncbi:hypothetical protein Q3G72_035399 [Acer saccharum]|nr:hypothetical protein Q3G72_035399 [Acer saccharum]
MLLRPPPPPFLLLLFAFFWVCPVHVAQAQTNQTQPTTDLEEARALNSIFQQWRISANQEHWNISGELCSGDAIATDTSDIDSSSGPNPYIKCVCTYNNNTLCHITRLKVYAQNVVGMIPDELWTLTFLTNLNLDQNYLTGPLSASVGNLTRMQYFTVGINALSGELPKELGKMTDMRSFGIGSNNFSGPLPFELGNWTKLEQLYIDSSGVSGEIPSTLAKLQNMATVWASDTELTGRIPDFIGNWSKLTSLSFQGNSFDGPIPSTFSNLTALTKLKISDLSNGSSTLAFMKDMKSLSFLELRNNNISDSIPSNIGEFQSLQHLDLSFNNLGGDIPDSLFNLSSLTNLFLGNNRLNGTLPAQKITTLRNMNVVANNLTIDSSNSSLNSALPFGLNCLQRNFPCNRGSGIYYNFSIKAGGPQITSSNGIVFERDNETLGPASYFVTGTTRWGVSNVGSFADNNNPQYKSSSSSQFTNTLDSELFQTARISASSLRYYDFIPSVSNIPPTSPKKNRTGLIAGIVVGVGLSILLSIIAILWIVRRRNKPRDDDEVLLGIDVKPYTFSYSVLKTATEDFSLANKLGEGGFGAVYKAWNLHENNRQVELVDSRLPEFNEEEVKRMIGVALLCTQTLPSLRPPMSRVVAMLCGDMEVSPVTTKPGYLTDWKYDDTTTTGSFMSSTDKATIGTEYNSNFTSSSTTMVADAQHSPANVTKPILHDIIGDAN